MSGLVYEPDKSLTEEQQIVEMYKNGASLATVAKYVHHNVFYVKDVLEKNNVSIRKKGNGNGGPRRVGKSVDEQKLVEDYLSGCNMHVLATRYKISSVRVQSILRLHNVQIRKAGRQNRGLTPKRKNVTTRKQNTKNKDRRVTSHSANRTTCAHCMRIISKKRAIKSKYRGIDVNVCSNECVDNMKYRFLIYGGMYYES